MGCMHSTNKGNPESGVPQAEARAARRRSRCLSCLARVSHDASLRAHADPARPELRRAPAVNAHKVLMGPAQDRREAETTSPLPQG